MQYYTDLYKHITYNNCFFVLHNLHPLKGLVYFLFETTTKILLIASMGNTGLQPNDFYFRVFTFWFDTEKALFQLILGLL